MCTDIHKICMYGICTIKSRATEEKLLAFGGIKGFASGDTSDFKRENFRIESGEGLWVDGPQGQSRGGGYSQGKATWGNAF